jgi:transketolase
MSDKIATRESYGNALAELGEKNPNVVVLDADLCESTKTVYFKKRFPDRFFDCGIAEANMVAVAAGLAACGKIPFCSSFAMFAAGRAFDQVRNAVGYPHLNVKIGATHAGITVGEDGATHQCLEDMGIMRTIPGMTVINPADDTEARAAVAAAAEWDGPVYMRFGRFAVPVIFDRATYKFEIGKGVLLTEGSDVTIVATGIMVDAALNAANLLKAKGIKAEVINIHTIKPIDRDLIIKSASKTGAVVTAEEHNIIGGLGSAVCEVLSESCPTPVMRVGTEDKFGRSGKVPPLLELYGLTPENIVCKSLEAISKKKK